MASEATLEKRRAYSKGYNAGRRGSWPDHKPPMPPHELTADLIVKARALRDGVDGELATFLDDEPVVQLVGPLIDALDDSLARVSDWLQTQMEPAITIEVHQHDWIPGFAAFAAGSADGPAHVVLNLGDLLGMVATGDAEPSELPYIVAESIMHEVIHALEEWAGVEFSEERVEVLIDKYRAYAIQQQSEEPKE